MTSSALDIARAYVTRSPPWNPVPVPYKKKGPTARKWQDRVITAENVEQFFNAKPMNIGIVLGPTSHGLVDLDLDCPEAIAIAPALLPPTKAIFGRASARGSHRL